MNSSHPTTIPPAKPVSSTRRTLALALAVALACLGAGGALADDINATPAAVLHARYLELQDHLSRNPFQRPLYMESRETSGDVTGDIYATVGYPFATVSAAMTDSAHWCEILLLHLNTKYCHASTGGRSSTLQVNIGKKSDQALADAYRVDFVYRVAAETSDYLQVALAASQGPLSTSDYRIIFEAVPLADGTTFLHFTYSYAYGLAGRLAMQAYLATLGSGKVGFTLAGDQADGPRYIGGMRGLVERNTMRYYLAIEAYLGALSATPQARLEKGLHDWFASIERYPRQLHELEQGEYLDMKRREYSRAQIDFGLPR